MLRACYGGTFDPVHCGHLAIARAVAETLQARVWMLPAADPPHRAAPGASSAQRARMLELAVHDDPRLGVDRRELLRSGPSFTVDTVRELRAECGPGVALVWVLGMDSVAQLDSWHHWRELLEHAHLLGVERPGAPVDPQWLRQQAPEVAEELAGRRVPPDRLDSRPAGLYAELPVRPLRPESATDVRARIAGGSDWEGLVPAAVARFIREQGLYGTAGRAGGV